MGVLGPRLVWGVQSGPLRHGRTREPPNPLDGFPLPRGRGSGAGSWLVVQSVGVTNSGGGMLWLLPGELPRGSPPRLSSQTTATSTCPGLYVDRPS